MSSDSPSTPPITDAKGRRPLEELLAESAELRKHYDDSFARLPAIERLTEVWAAKDSLAPDDPIFVIAEMLGLYEIRYRAITKGLVDILQQQDEVVATLITELEDRMAEVSQLKVAIGELKIIITALKTDQSRLAEINVHFLELLPDVQEGITSAAKLINDKTLKSVLLTWAGLFVAFGAGAALTILIKAF